MPERTMVRPKRHWRHELLALAPVMALAVANTFFRLAMSPFPISTVRKRLMAVERELVTIAIIDTKLPTVSYTPRSSIPSAPSTILAVNRPITISISIREYKAKVFLAMRLLLSDI